MTNKWHDTINTDNDHNTVNDTDIPDDDLADGDEIWVHLLTNRKEYESYFVSAILLKGLILVQSKIMF